MNKAVTRAPVGIREIWRLAVKRTLDIVAATLGLLVLAPVLLAVAAAVKVDSPGPVFYRGVRVGHFGKPFRMFKFRTLVDGADRLGGSSTPADDPRLTRVGRRLRKFKLDEFPQLINVVLGEMSLVGPRPEVPDYVALYTDDQKRILSVRPGITDYASLRFSNEAEILKGAADPEKTYLASIRPDKLRLGLAYVDNFSLSLDLKTLAMTFTRMFRGSSAWSYRQELSMIRELARRPRER